jgi:phosphopantothenoylcysteine synthetase/decarboxylase
VARIVLGVSGSIAAYKAADLCSHLVQAGHEVTAILTPAATRLVGPLTFATLTGRPAFSDMFDREEWARVEHIDLADRADLVLVAPATADLLGKAANGLADDMLTTLLLAAKGPVAAAPAMNPRMWAHPAVRANCERLRGFGWTFLGPDEGTVACGHVGTGRMAEPAALADAVEALLAAPAPPPAGAAGAAGAGEAATPTAAGDSIVYPGPVRRGGRGGRGAGDGGGRGSARDGGRGRRGS